MALFYYYNYYLCFLLVFYTKYLEAYSCHVCDTLSFNYSITINNLPSPTDDSCKIITAETGCFTAIQWYDDKTSQVLYGTNPGFPRDIVNVQTRRIVDISSNIYSTQKYIGFVCGSSDSMPCNTIENLKLSILSTTLPTGEKIQEFDSLIIPSKSFDGNLCFQFTNMTNECPEVDVPNCKQCLIAIEYSQEIDICATCPEDDPTINFIIYDTTFFLNNRTQFQEVSLTCQTNNACNSITNIQEIRKTSISKFDFDKFSTASTSKSTIIILLITLFIGFDNILFLN